MSNPKLVGSNIVDCIPQTGECPQKCSECFFNGGRFYRTLDEPLLPTLEEVGDKIVRVNSGNDSNNKKQLVIDSTKQYKHKFYNTSYPHFDFPSPVVFTCNPKEKVFLVNKVDNLMFVRVRTTPWNLEDVDKVVEHYLKKHNVPVLLTFMRFYNGDLIPVEYKSDFEWVKHISNDYYCLKTETVFEILARYKKTGVLTCGNNVSSSCVDCRNCEFLYWEWRRKNEKNRVSHF